MEAEMIKLEEDKNEAYHIRSKAKGKPHALQLIKKPQLLSGAILKIKKRLSVYK